MPADSSLARVLEPEVMDSAEEAREYDAMDHRYVNECFVADFLVVAKQAKLADDVEVLDLGTGTAQIPIELCAKHKHARVVAIDLSAEMLQLARENVARAGLSERITLQQVDAKGLPFADGRFGAVISNSIVHHIAQPEFVLAEALRVLAPGGAIFVRDLMRPHDEAYLQLLVERYAAGCTPRQTELFAASLRAALTVDEVRSMLGPLGWRAKFIVPTSDRHWTWMGTKAAQ